MKCRVIVIGIVLFFFRFEAFGLEKIDDVIHVQEVYKTIDSLSLAIDIFYSTKALKGEGNTAIVFYHGGGWVYGESSEFFSTCERYAQMGTVAFSVEYRLSIENGKTPHPTISPIECLMDAKSAIRWIRANAKKYNIDVSKVVAAGQSAGGYLAISTAMINEFDEVTDDLLISCVPNAVMLFSATVNVIEPWFDHLLTTRRSKIWSLSPAHNIKEDLPPMIHFHGTEDEQVPFYTIRFFARDTKECGNYFELNTYQGRKHYLGGDNPKYSRYFDDEILEVADEFLRNQDLLN